MAAKQQDAHVDAHLLYLVNACEAVHQAEEMQLRLDRNYQLTCVAAAEHAAASWPVDSPEWRKAVSYLDKIADDQFQTDQQVGLYVVQAEAYRDKQLDDYPG